MRKLEIDMNILDPDVYKAAHKPKKMDVQRLFTVKNQNALLI